MPRLPRLLSLGIHADPSSIGGFVAAWFNTTYFIQEQFPQSAIQAMLPISANTKIVALQLGNLYGLMCLLGLTILNTTSERKVVRGYIACLAVADVGHVLPTMYYLGQERVLDVGNWNGMAWGNIAATTALFATRLLYLAGVFDGVATKGKKA